MLSNNFSKKEIHDFSVPGRNLRNFVSPSSVKKISGFSGYFNAYHWERLNISSPLSSFGMVHGNALQKCYWLLQQYPRLIKKDILDTLLEMIGQWYNEDVPSVHGLILSYRNKRSDSVRTIEEFPLEYVAQTCKLKTPFIEVNQQFVEMLPTTYFFKPAVFTT